MDVSEYKKMHDFTHGLEEHK